MKGEASQSYLAMANWCDRNGLSGCADFFYRQSLEEHAHMMKIVHYMNEMEGIVKITSLDEPQNDFADVHQVFHSAYDQERNVTKAIDRLVQLSQKENDNATYHFLQWFVAEQQEEESMMRNIEDKLKLIGDGPMSLYYIDKEIEQINSSILKVAAQEDK